MCPFLDELKAAALYKGRYRKTMHFTHMVPFGTQTLPGSGKAAVVLQPFSKE